MTKLIITLFFFLCYIFGFAQDRKQEKPKIGLVLSGGGAKGYAHIGAIKAIEEAGFEVHFVGGTSMGAIVGGLFASGYSGSDLETIVKRIDFTELLVNEKQRAETPYVDKAYREKYILELPFDDFQLQIPSALSKGQGSADVLAYYLKHVHAVEDFNQLPIPFLCIATELETGESVSFRNGFLPQAILASGAYPALIKPIKINGTLYTDGGVTNNFPAEQVKEMGADYIIGLQLSKGLLKSEQLNSATKTIEQLIRYNIVKNNEYQKQFVDLLIEPDLSQYSVVDFDQKDSIINKGYEETKRALQNINAKDFKQKTNPSKTKLLQLPGVNDTVRITGLTINGLDKFSRSYVKGKLNLDLPKTLKYKDLSNGIQALYASGNYNNIFYKLEENDQGKILILNLEENPTKLLAKFALRYDDLYKTSLLVNLTAKRFLFNNSTLSADLILGDHLRYSVNLFINNGLYPSFGVNAIYNQFEADLNLNQGELNEITYQWNEFKNQIYTQTTLAEKYAFGLGLEHQYLNFFADNLPNTSEFQTLEDQDYLNAYAFLGADNRNAAYFPKSGFKLDARLKLLNPINNIQILDLALFKASMEYNIPITNYVSFFNHLDLGTSFGNSAGFGQQFIIGGFNQQEFANSITFYGEEFGSQTANHMIGFRAGVQFNLFRNHYISPQFNLANMENSFSNIKFTDYTYRSFGLHYGYKSPFGPLNFYWFYNPRTKKDLFNVSLGFWF